MVQQIDLLQIDDQGSFACCWCCSIRCVSLLGFALMAHALMAHHALIGRYYYNKWMTQRIHAALLELHLPAVAARTSLPLPWSHHGQGNAAQGAAPFSLPAGDSQQLMAAADALLGPDAEAVLAAAATAAGLQTISNPDNGCSKSSPVMSGTSQQFQPQQLYELPRPILEKLLSLDAGDLDLMIQHPRALQGQVRSGVVAALAARQNWHGQPSLESANSQPTRTTTRTHKSRQRTTGENSLTLG